jgi:peroxiredoxin
MRHRCTGLLACGLLWAVTAVGFAQAPGKLGDPAPSISVHAWLKGSPVTFQQNTNIYVLVFCTLSRANPFALASLNHLQERYAGQGVIVAVISDDLPQELQAYIQAQGTNIEFSVAADEQRQTTTIYQAAFQQWVLPRAYVVNRLGRVLWFGHPMRDDLATALDDIIAGRFLLASAEKQMLAREQLERYLQLARSGDPRTREAGQMLLSARTNDASALCELASRIATDPRIPERDFATANCALDRAAQLTSTNATTLAITRAILLFQAGQKDAALARAKQALVEAQNEEEKQIVENCLHTMEARLTAAQGSPPTPPATNP